MTNIGEVLYTSDWVDVIHPHTHRMKIAEFKISLCKKNNTKKWVASFKRYTHSYSEWLKENWLYRDQHDELMQYSKIIGQYEDKIIYLPLNHCSTSPSCIRRAKAEASIWLEELLGFRTNLHHKINIDSIHYQKLNDENLTVLGRDNRSVWGADFITTKVKDNEKIYTVVYYVRFIPVHETFPDKYQHPRIEIGYHREDEFYFAMDLLNPYLDKIQKIIHENYKNKYSHIDYDIIHRQNYRELVI